MTNTVNKIQLVEKHNISQGHKYYKEIDNLSFKSKNLYNKANYIIRQDYFNKLKENNISFTSKYLNYYKLFHLIKSSDEYKSLPAKVSNSILQVLDKNWKSFVKSTNQYYKTPDKFKSKPKLPRYKNPDTGKNILIYDKQALNKKYLNKGFVLLSGTGIKVSTRIDFNNIKQIRIVPKNNEYCVEIVYERELDKILCDKQKNDSDNNKDELDRILSIDLGVNNLCTVTSNIKNQRPIIINGRPLKSINQYYNKQKAILQSYIGDKGTSNRIKKLTNKKNNLIQNYMHKVSKQIIDYAVKLNIDTIVIGKNEDWKQNINIGKKSNQNFVQIPFNKLIQMIQYKCQLVGIKIILTEESYTSKCSFIDNEYPEKHESYVGKRIKRGLFKTSKGLLINADVNGSYNILRKVFPDFKYGIEAVAVQPIKMKIKISS